MNPLTVRRYHATQVDRNKWIGTDKDLGTQVEAPTLTALIGLLVPDGLGVNVNVKIRPMGLRQEEEGRSDAQSDAQLDAQLIEAAQGYLDSKRLDKLDAWLHVGLERPLSRAIETQSDGSLIAYPNGALIDGPTAPTLRELIDKL